MTESREPIQVSFRLPAGSLEGFTRLVEQLRQLAAEVSGGGGVPSSAGPPAERAENSSFDAERFDALHRTVEAPASAQAHISSVADPQPVQAAAQSAAPDPVRAGWDLESVPPGAPVTPQPDWPDLPQASAAHPAETQDLPDASGVRPLPPEDLPQASAAYVPDGTPLPNPPAVQAHESSTSDAIPTAQAAPVQPLPDAPQVRMEPESSIPAAEAVWAETAQRIADPESAAPGALSGAETPLGAGFVVSAGPEMAQSHRTNVTEELAVAGPAPLTAEAVSAAFRRDGRRYDNGFPLY